VGTACGRIRALSFSDAHPTLVNEQVFWQREAGGGWRATLASKGVFAAAQEMIFVSWRLPARLIASAITQSENSRTVPDRCESTSWSLRSAGGLEGGGGAHQRRENVGNAGSGEATGRRAVACDNVPASSPANDAGEKHGDSASATATSFPEKKSTQGLQPSACAARVKSGGPPPMATIVHGGFPASRRPAQSGPPETGKLLIEAVAPCIHALVACHPESARSDPLVRYCCTRVMLRARECGAS